MKSLFNKSDNEEILNRINSLTPETKGGWGKMNVSQMMTHAQAPLKIAFGELRLKRTLIGFLFGRIAKKKLSSERQWGKNFPTDKSFVVAEQRNFEEEKVRLIALVRRFVHSGPAGISNETHPFFGNLTVNEWDRLMWNHLDHHLRQFGA
jgi:Protein of unknown function (DUF1569)